MYAKDEAPTAQLVITPEVQVADAVPVSEAELDIKATSLRRGASALLFFSMLCMRPWPTPAWLGLLASFLLLCASSSRLPCRARVAQCLSFVVAIFSVAAIVCVAIAFHKSMPTRVSEKVHTQCLSMPEDTIAWGKETVKAFRFHRHLETTKIETAMSTPPMLIISDTNSTGGALVEPSEQEEVCDKVAHMVKCFGSMFLIASTIAHVGLLMSALAVAKRACRFRRALGYTCRGRCVAKRMAVTAVVTPPDAAKELA